MESRKAIWQEFGTSNGVRPKRMIENTVSSFGGASVSALTQELELALEKAIKEAASGRNPKRDF
jgi:hypothetical protein